MVKAVCGLCLAQTHIYASLTEEKTAKMLEALTSIKTSSSDFSHVICVKCQLNLKLAYSIQQNMIRANERLVQRLLVKEEIHLVDDASNDDMIKKEKIDDDRKNCIQLCNSRCIICGLNTDVISNHVKQHFNQKQNCDLCEKSFNNIQLYKNHLTSHPQKNKIHQCHKCGISFYYRSLYHIHLENAHKDAKRSIMDLLPKPGSFSCELCPRTFTCKIKFYSHKINHKRKQCPICHKELAMNSIRQHILDHSDNPQICEICGATLKNKSCLRTHMKNSHSDERYKCSKCDKIFKKRMSWNIHQRSAHGNPTHICDTCGKRFFTRERLNVHMKMTHMKLRPYVCEFCKKGFSSKFALTTHRRQHTMETPYRCEICGEGFRQNVSLKGHRKSKHNIEEPKTCKCDVCGKAFASVWALKSHCRLH